MTLAAGTVLGQYEILSPLGAGGMGEVYRAKDTKLEREVAIKVLPEAFSRDPERVARFQREAKLLASLNHPNIAAIYGFEEADDRRFLVMELVEGETLAERLKASGASGLPLDDALGINKQIAEALEAAHERGVIHRDLKPANVKITPEGRVKVLDFGLAKAMADAEERSSTQIANSPTITAGHSPTAPGVVLGTAAYMSPEQARGRKLDKRTDIWSFGVVLLECLTGRSPFAGETVSDSIGAILHKDPQWEDLPAATPPTIQLLLRRCLCRDVAMRLRDVGDARIELASAIADPTSSVLGLAASAIREETTYDRTARRSGLVTSATVLVVAVIGIVVGRSMSPESTPLVRKYELPLQQQGTWNAGLPAISPDGSMVAYADRDRIWIRRLDSFDAQEVVGSEDGLVPFWSPDSRWLGFARGGDLIKVPVEGGRPIVVASMPTSFSFVAGADWTRDNRIVFSNGDTPIMEVSADGGEPRVWVPTGPDDDDFHELALLPDDRHVVFTVHSRTRPWYLAVSDGVNRKVVLALEGHNLTAPAYSPTGHILFQRAAETDSVWALPYSVERLEATGEPFLVSPDDGDPSVSDTGVLVMTKRINALAGRTLVKFDLSTDEVEPLLTAEKVFYDPALSPDGKSLAVAGFGIAGVDLWLLDLATSSRNRLTYDAETNELRPHWSPDGREIAYTKTTGTTFDRIGSQNSIHFIDTATVAESRAPIDGGFPTFDRDWKSLAFVRANEETARDIYYLPLDGSSEAKAIVAGDASEEQPAISPDGQWLAYTSDETGIQHVYLTKLPDAQGKWQVSNGHGAFPAWSPDSRRIYFIGDGVSVHHVDLTTEPRVMVNRPQDVLDCTRLGVNPFQGFIPENEVLIVIQANTAGGTSSLGVIDNWFDEFAGRQ